ncbi:MAG: hypothetical protein LBM98_09145 [Oscillospiraceae bacterium]|nr:hypothetical protein [Oscillospiraceae bacterium]
MRYVQCYRCEAIQCRENNKRMLRSRHWIAARLYVLRIASAAALAKTAHCAGTGAGASLIWSLDEGYAIRARRGALPLHTVAVHLLLQNAKGGFQTRPYVYLCDPFPTSRLTQPVPRRAQPSSKPSSLIFDI